MKEKQLHFLLETGKRPIDILLSFKEEWLISPEIKDFLLQEEYLPPNVITAAGFFKQQIAISREIKARQGEAIFLVNLGRFCIPGFSISVA